jgi:CelD/BcsL family acetyltransferase involved in cellulose biosynthesis
VSRWTTEIRRDPGVYAELSEWWDSQPAALAVPFLNTHLLACWEEGFDEPGSRRHVMLLRRDGEIVAGLPLYRSRGRLRTPARAHADSIDVVAVDDVEVGHHLPEWLDSLTIAHLYRFREGSSVVEAVPAYPRWSIPAVLKSPYVDLSGGMEEVRAGLGKDFARTLRRRRRRLEELGPVTYVDHPAPQDVESVLDEGLRLEAEGWKGREGVAVLNQPANERWYRSVAEVAQDQGWLRLSALYLDERMLAFRYDLHYGQRRYGQISSYDESPDMALSTGSLLLESALEQSATEGVATYEFGYGSHPWKYDWTSNERFVYDLLIFGSGPFGRLLSAARRARLGKSQGLQSAGAT